MVRLIHKLNQTVLSVQRNAVTIRSLDKTTNHATSQMLKCSSQQKNEATKSPKLLLQGSHMSKVEGYCRSELHTEHVSRFSTVRNFSHSSCSWSVGSDFSNETQDDEVLKDLALSAAPLARSVFKSAYNNGVADARITPKNGLSDLQMFLQEVGTDPKEARFWLKHFQSSVDPHRPFALVQVDQEVIHNKKTLHGLCSCLSFLHRHQMQVIIIHGPITPSSDSKEEYWGFRKQLVNDSMMLVDALEQYDTVPRPLFHGSSIFRVQQNDPSCPQPKLTICVDTILWALRSTSVVIVQGLGESSDGRLVPIDITAATGAIAKELKPLKVLLINNRGGLTNDNGQVIANINIPSDLNNIFQSSWCTTMTKQKINDVVSLLHCLPSQSSVVIASATRLLAELFTHRGSGTFFKMSESIHKFKNVKEVDGDKLSKLIESGFRRALDEQYLEKLDKQLNTLYIVDGYNAAAIVTNEDGIPIPYLDKFVVCSSRSGESLGQMLWDAIRTDFPRLFWRSRNNNIINNWYFTQCEGCRRYEHWTVFWYGAVTESLSIQLSEHALGLPSSFSATKQTKQQNHV